MSHRFVLEFWISWDLGLRILEPRIDMLIHGRAVHSNLLRGGGMRLPQAGGEVTSPFGPHCWQVGVRASGGRWVIFVGVHRPVWRKLCRSALGSRRCELRTAVIRQRWRRACRLGFVRCGRLRAG